MARGGIRFHVVEGVGEGSRRDSPAAGLTVTPEGVFFFVVAEAAPGSRVFGEDDGPLILVGNHVQAVSARGERLAFDGGVIGEGDGGVFVGTGAPDFSVGHDFAPRLRGRWQADGCS